MKIFTEMDSTGSIDGVDIETHAFLRPIKTDSSSMSTSNIHLKTGSNRIVTVSDLVDTGITKKESLEFVSLEDFKIDHWQRLKTNKVGVRGCDFK